MMFRLCAVLLALVVALVVAELALRALGFRYELRAVVVEGAAPDARTVHEHYITDRDLIWVPRTYGQRLELAREQGAAIVFMGDSCTQFGKYPEALMTFITHKHAGGVAVPFAKLGVAGWSTHQGLAQLQRDVAPLRPRVVTIYYGWNDHWLSIGIDDADVGYLLHHPLLRWSDLRITQLLMRAHVAWHAPDDRADYPVRVALDDYKANLHAMIDAVRAIGAVPVVLTAPSGHVPGEEPAYLARRHVADLGQLIPLHERYVQATRDVAREADAVLCDLAAAFAAQPGDGLFSNDGIHLTRDGDVRIAQLLYACLLEHELIDPLVTEQ